MTLPTTPALRRGPTLADQLTGARSWLGSTLLVAAGASVVGLSAQIAVPLWPVPITGQTLAVLVVASALGALRGGMALIVYAIGGIIGLPWFSDSSAGWQVVAGPTGGYIVGFVVAAVLVGLLAEHRWDRRPLLALTAFAAGTIVPFAVGLPWLAAVLGLDLTQTLEAGLYPFLLGGAVKALIAAAIVPAAWRVTLGAQTRAQSRTDLS